MKSSSGSADRDCGEALHARVEDAGINASAPTQQLWIDGWIVRFSPGKAKRARCVNAVAPGKLPLDDKLRLAGRTFDEAALPIVVRITPFSQPADLDSELARRGWTLLDDTRVMVRQHLPAAAPPPLPSGLHWVRLGAAAYAQAVGELRDSPSAQRQAHAERLASSPVPYHGYAIVGATDRTVLACGQFACQADLVGLYDVYTRETERSKGLARILCERLLSLAVADGASIAYLQVDATNLPAHSLYRRLGFADAYAYHYRQAPPGWRPQT